MTVVLPLEDAFETNLVQDLDADAAALVLYCAEVPNLTIPAGYYLPVTVNPRKGFEKQENMEITSIDAVEKTITVRASGRARPRYYGDSYSAKSHVIGARVIITDNYQVWTEVDARLIRAGDTMTGRLKFSGTNATVQPPAFANTTLRDAAITVPLDGDLCTVAGDLYHYNATTVQWELVDTGTPTPNASTTVAGKVEEATVAQLGAGTAAGETGARLFINPSSFVKTSSGAGDENKGAVLGADGKFATGFIPSISTDSMVHSTPAGEATDGTTTPQAVYISDGTNSRTSGRFYKADANDTTNMAVRFFGFVTANASSVGTSYDVKYGGVVSGFSGLTIGVEYYLSDTAGAIASAPVSSIAVPIGIAISATELAILPQTKTIYATYSHSTSSGETVDTTLSIGFRARFIIAYAQNADSVTTGKASMGWWHAGLTGGVSHGDADVNTTNAYGVADDDALLVVADIPSTPAYITYTVNAVAANTVTIRRVSTSSTSSNIVHLTIFG